jgi:hypothetical protein
MTSVNIRMVKVRKENETALQEMLSNRQTETIQRGLPNGTFEQWRADLVFEVANLGGQGGLSQS